MNDIPNNKSIDKPIANGESSVYRSMYQTLFREISKVLTILNEKDADSAEHAIQILENAQCESEEIFVTTEQSSGIYSELYKRLNLQSIGHFIKEGHNLKEMNIISFAEREREAERELDKDLNKLLDEKATQEAYSTIIKYTSVKEEIQFSLGMKAGAKLTLLLTNESDHDF